MSLSSAASINIGKRLLGKYTAAGWLPTTAINRIQSLGYGWKRQTMFKDFHRFQQAEGRRKAIADFPKHRKPTKGIMEDIHLRRARKYWVIGEATFWDEETKTEVTQGISWYTNKSLSIDDWITDYINEKYPDKYPGEPIPIGIDVIDIKHNQGFPY